LISLKDAERGGCEKDADRHVQIVARGVVGESSTDQEGPPSSPGLPKHNDNRSCPEDSPKLKTTGNPQSSRCVHNDPCRRDIRPNCTVAKPPRPAVRHRSLATHPNSDSERRFAPFPRRRLDRSPPEARVIYFNDEAMTPDETCIPTIPSHHLHPQICSPSGTQDTGREPLSSRCLPRRSGEAKERISRRRP